jgi:hypothetical protein
MPRPNHFFVLSGCVLFGGTMFALPSILRVIVPHQVQREKLTGSQRQRGMYMNAGRLILEWPDYFLLRFWWCVAPSPLFGCRVHNSACFIEISLQFLSHHFDNYVAMSLSAHYPAYCPIFLLLPPPHRQPTIALTEHCLKLYNTGSSDLGPDPDWDVKNSRWLGHDKK